uniref:YPDG domain-containing protein n=1 Tax=Corynebacterium jeikeium TaxID=38289 RepID=UPI000AA70727
MANLRGRIIRTGFGARALAFKNNSMKSIAAAGAVLALATTGTVVVQTQAAPAALAEQDQGAGENAQPSQDQIIEADAIASGRVTKAANLTDAHGVGKGLISGHVYMATPGGNPGAAYDNGNVKMDGITVYAQFRDKDGSYSPVFSAKTHTLPDVVGGNGGKGTFAFGTGGKGITWTDKLGREHTWAARTDQKHRIWVEPFTNDRGNKVVMFRQANGFVPGSFNGLVEAPLGSFAAADGNIQLMAAFLQEVPPNHETSWMAAKGDKLVEDPEGPISRASTQTDVPNTVSGRVWLETGGPDKGIVATGPSKNGIDEAADGYTVYASTLTKDGAAANQKLHEQYKDDPSKLAAETKKMLEDHPEYILKTVHGKTDNEGNYTLRFGKYEKGQDREDVLNPNHVFVWVENKDGVVQNGYTGFHTPIFQRFNDGGNFRASAIPGENQLLINFNGLPFQNLNSLYNVNYGIMPYTPVSITADYNATDKPAAPGTKVTPEFHGDLSDLPSKVEWRDQKGKVLKTCELDQSKGIKAQVAECTFDIPKDAKKGDYYNVVLVSGGNDVSAWTVLVTKDSDEYTPEYEDKLVVPGEETKSTPTFTKTGEDAEGNPTEEKVDTPEGSKFSIPEDFKAPEGYEVSIDENTGEITVTYPDKSKLNKDTVEEFDVPVTVTYPDETTDEVKANFKLDTDGDGKPDTEDDDDDNDGIPDKDDSNPKVPNQNLDFEPEYKDGSGKPGSDVKIDAPTFKDKDGKDTKAPEGTKFTPGENAPEGVTINENTGEITVKIPEGAEPGDKITVPVVVTYPDGTKDTVDVTVTVEQPDVKTTDGIDPEYKDGSGKPGEDVTVDKPVFKDGNGEETTPPEGTKFEKGEGAPENVTVNEDGSITVKVPEDAKPGEKITVPVEVTYPDGSKDNVDVTVTVEEPDTPEQPEVPAKVDYRPSYGDPVVVPAGGSKTAEIAYPEDQTAPEGTKYILDPSYTVPHGWKIEVDEATGKVTATVVEAGPNGARQEELVVPVQVKYPESANATGDDVANATFLLDTDKDGTPDTTDEDDDGDGVNDQEEKDNGSDPKDPNSKPEAPVNDFQPSYEEKTVPAGQSVTSDVTFTGEPKPESTKFSIAENFVAPHGWTFEVDPETGTVTATVVPAGPDGARQEQVIVPIDVTYPDGTATSDDTANAVFNLDTDADGTPDSKDDDDDDDGFTDEEEKENGTDPKDPNDKPQPEAPAEKPDWNDTSTTPDEPVDIPNTGGDVPEGTTVETDGPGKAEIGE